MSRYIDYDAIDYRNDMLHDKSEEFLNGVIYMAQRIEDAPSIDIAFCNECKIKEDCPLRLIANLEYCSIGEKE